MREMYGWVRGTRLESQYSRSRGTGCLWIWSQHSLHTSSRAARVTWRPCLLKGGMTTNMNTTGRVTQCYKIIANCAYWKEANVSFVGDHKAMRLHFQKRSNLLYNVIFKKPMLSKQLISHTENLASLFSHMLLRALISTTLSSIIP